MKTKMLIFVFLLGITDLFAQTLYVPRTIVKGKNASYYCSSENEIFIKVNNVNNVDTTTTMYYDDDGHCYRRGADDRPRHQGSHREVNFSQRALQGLLQDRKSVV